MKYPHNNNVLIATRWARKELNKWAAGRQSTKSLKAKLARFYRY